MVLDLWANVQGLFVGDEDDTPEIMLVNLTDEQTVDCIRLLVDRARECSTQFNLAGTPYSVIVSSLDVALDLLLLRKVSGAFWLSLPVLPQLAIIVERPGTIIVSYERGKWSAMSVIAFFDLLHELLSHAPNARLRLDDAFFSTDQKNLFAKVWQAYQHVAS